MARQIAIDSTGWPPQPAGQGRGVCGYVDPLIYRDLTHLDPMDPLLPVYGIHRQCKPCLAEGDCTTNDPLIDDPHTPGNDPDCVITSSEKVGTNGEFKVGKSIACNACIPPRWKVRTIFPDVSPDV